MTPDAEPSENGRAKALVVPDTQLMKESSRQKVARGRNQAALAQILHKKRGNKVRKNSSENKENISTDHATSSNYEQPNSLKRQSRHCLLSVVNHRTQAHQLQQNQIRIADECVYFTG